MKKGLRSKSCHFSGLRGFNVWHFMTARSGSTGQLVKQFYGLISTKGFREGARSLRMEMRDSVSIRQKQAKFAVTFQIVAL